MRQFLIGLLIAVPMVLLCLLFAVLYWKLALVGMTLLLVGLAALVAVAVAAMPLGYLVVALYYYFRPQEPSTSTSYSIEQGREVDARGSKSSARQQDNIESR